MFQTWFFSSNLNHFSGVVTRRHKLCRPENTVPRWRPMYLAYTCVYHCVISFLLNPWLFLVTSPPKIRTCQEYCHRACTLCSTKRFFKFICHFVLVPRIKPRALHVQSKYSATDTLLSPRCSYKRCVQEKKPRKSLDLALPPLLVNWRNTGRQLDRLNNKWANV